MIHPSLIVINKSLLEYSDVLMIQQILYVVIMMTTYKMFVRSFVINFLVLKLQFSFMLGNSKVLFLA